jgi:hypothetical protein
MFEPIVMDRDGPAASGPLRALPPAPKWPRITIQKRILELRGRMGRLSAPQRCCRRHIGCNWGADSAARLRKGLWEAAFAGIPGRDHREGYPKIPATLTCPRMPSRTCDALSLNFEDYQGVF